MKEFTYAFILETFIISIKCKQAQFIIKRSVAYLQQMSY